MILSVLGLRGSPAADGRGRKGELHSVETLPVIRAPCRNNGQALGVAWRLFVSCEHRSHGEGERNHKESLAKYERKWMQTQAPDMMIAIANLRCHGKHEIHSHA